MIEGRPHPDDVPLQGRKHQSCARGRHVVDTRASLCVLLLPHVWGPSCTNRLHPACGIITMCKQHGTVWAKTHLMASGAKEERPK